MKDIYNKGRRAFKQGKEDTAPKGLSEEERLAWYNGFFDARTEKRTGMNKRQWGNKNEKQREKGEFDVGFKKQEQNSKKLMSNRFGIFGDYDFGGY